MFKIHNARKEEAFDKLKEIFSEHVGRGNPISSENLFIKLVGTNPEDLDFYERQYKWNAIKRMLGLLRKNGELFVIMGPNHHYVLSDKEELEDYNNRVDATIKGLNIMKGKAAVWVKSQELQELKKKKKKKKLLKAFKQ